MIKKKATGLAASFPAGLGIGALVSMGITVITAGICAWLMGREILKEDAIGIASALILLLSSGFGAWVSYGKIKHRRLMVCMLSGGIYYLLLLSCTALFFGGQYQGMAVSGLVVLAGCGVVALLGLRGEGRSKHRKKLRTR